MHYNSEHAFKYTAPQLLHTCKSFFTRQLYVAKWRRKCDLTVAVTIRLMVLYKEPTKTTEGQAMLQNTCAQYQCNLIPGY